MVTVRKSFAQTLREQIEAETRNELERQRMDWIAEQPARTMLPPHSHPEWVSPSGDERVHVTFRSNRAAAVERVARKIARTTPALRFGWEFSRCDGAYFLRDHGWRLLPDDVTGR